MGKRFMLKFLSLTLLLVTACAPESMAPRADQREDSQNNTTASNTSNTNSMTGTGNVTTGAELYRTYCETCHGPEGTGAAVWSGNIQGIDPIHDIVKNGQGSMPPVPTTDQQTADIQAYLNSFNTPDPSTLTGIEAYANLCGSCHGSEGQGTASGPIIQFPVAGYAKWVTRNGRPGADYPGPMSAYGTDRLTDAQLDEIIDVLIGGRFTDPTPSQKADPL